VSARSRRTARRTPDRQRIRGDELAGDGEREQRVQRVDDRRLAPPGEPGAAQAVQQRR
jgi:hypothetical protein